MFIHGKHIGMLPYQTHVSSTCSPFLQMAIEKILYIPPTHSTPHSGHFTWWLYEQEAFLPKLTSRDSCMCLTSCNNNFYKKKKNPMLLLIYSETNRYDMHLIKLQCEWNKSQVARKRYSIISSGHGTNDLHNISILLHIEKKLK